MKITINEASTMHASFEEDVRAYSAAGFTAIELWLEKVGEYLKKHSLSDAGRLLSDNGLETAGACYHADVMVSEGEVRRRILDEFRWKLDVCSALGAPVLIVPGDLFERDPVPADYERAVDGLAEAADIANEYSIDLGIEFLQKARFIQTLRTALALARKTRKENVGLLIDTFHLYAGKSKVEDILLADKGEITFVHINDMRDVPIELATDADRVIPGEGIFPLYEMVRSVQRTGYSGYYSVELFNKDLWDMNPVEASKLIYEGTTAFFEKIRERDD